MLATATHVTFLLSLLLYIASALLFCCRLIFNNKFFVVMALRLTLAGFALQIIALGSHLFQSQYPYIESSFESYQLVSFGVLAIFLFLSFRFRYVATGFILVPIAVVFFSLSLTTVVSYHRPEHFLVNPWALIHLLLVFISLSLFVVSFVTGLLYLLSEYQLRHRILGGLVDRLPPLEILDLIHYKALYTGFIFFSLGIITGGGWNKSVSGFYVSNDVKESASFGLWLFFAVFLYLRTKRGWVGRRGIILSSSGFVALICLFIWVQGF